MIRQLMGRASSRYAAIFLITVLAAGCTATVPVGKYDALAESSQKILSGTSETYTRIEKLQRRFSVETASGQTLNRDSFKPVIEGQSFDIGPELDFREAALQVLVKYSLVLQAFAKRDFEGEVDKASVELAGSLKSLAATAAPKGDNVAQASGILAAVVDVIGREIVRQKRLEALRMVMDAAQPDLDKLATLITGSNDKINRFTNIMLDRILAHRSAARPAPNNPMRFEYDMDAALVIAEVDEINAALADLNAAVTQFPPAHAEVRAQLDKNPQGVQSLQQLVEEAQRVDKFYRTVK